MESDKEVIIRDMILAVDGSEGSDRAAEMAGKLSSCFESNVDILNVVPEKELVAPQFQSYVYEYSRLEKTDVTMRGLLESAGRNVVSSAASLVRKSGGSVRGEDVVFGRPAQEIVSYAERKDADCIIMGRRGLGEIKGLLLGSVSHRVGQLSDRTLITTS